MQNKPEYIYIMYPIPIEEAQKLPFLKPMSINPPPYANTTDESFMPLWFGNARFPEDDTD